MSLEYDRKHAINHPPKGKAKNAKEPVRLFAAWFWFLGRFTQGERHREESWFGALVATSTLPVRNVLPGVVRKVEASVGDGLWLGKYTVLLDATYGDKGQELVSKQYVWVVPWRTQGWKALLFLGFLVWVIGARRRFRAFWYVLKTGLPPPKDL